MFCEYTTLGPTYLPTGEEYSDAIVQLVSQLDAVLHAGNIARQQRLERRGLGGQLPYPSAGGIDYGGITVTFVIPMTEETLTLHLKTLGERRPVTPAEKKEWICKWRNEVIPDPTQGWCYPHILCDAQRCPADHFESSETGAVTDARESGCDCDVTVRRLARVNLGEAHSQKGEPSSPST